MTRSSNDQKCAHGHLCPAWSRDDSLWYTTKRHAIYADTLVLPLFGRESDPGRPPRQILLTPTPHIPEVGRPSCRHYHVKTHCPEDASSRTSDDVVRVSPRMVSSSWSETFIPTRRFSLQPRASTEHSSLPPVPHLRLVRKPRNSSTPKARTTYKPSVVHTRLLKHSELIVDLLAQLDQAIKDWSDLGRDPAEYHNKIFTTGDSHL